LVYSSGIPEKAENAVWELSLLKIGEILFSSFSLYYSFEFFELNIDILALD